MRIIQNQHWRKIKYGNTTEFEFWSEKVKGKGDESLLPGTPFESWRKIVILKPLGKPESTFSMGFSSIFGKTEISDATRKVKDGPFGMRMGPEDCEFFVASDDDSIGLDFNVKYVDIAELESDLY